MKIKEYKCGCGCKDFFFKVKGNQTGIYCSSCGKWLKWADKNERNLMNSDNTVENVRDAESYCDGFHKGGCYHTELYRVSNGMYIRAKSNGKKMYLLYKAESFKDYTQAGSAMLDFSQANFIARATQYFPETAG